MTLESRRMVAAPSDSAKRIVENGPDAGREVVLIVGRPCTVGRNADCHIRVADDGHTSRYHVMLEARLDCVLVRDLDSRNGTYVNGERTAQAELRARPTSMAPLRASIITSRARPRWCSPKMGASPPRWSSTRGCS